MKLFTAIIVATFLVTVQATAAAAELVPYEEQWETPPLELPDLAGRRHTIETCRGRVVLLNFWASWCPPCVVEMPGMQRLAAAFSDRPFSLVTVNFRESRSTVWRFRKLLKVDFMMLLDTTGETAEAWDVQVYPTSYLLDTEGRIRYVAYGAVDWDSPQTLQRVEDLLSENNATQAMLEAGPGGTR